MNSENGQSGKRDEISSVSSQAESTETFLECHSSSKISSQHRHNGAVKNKMKKPDLPIYVPRGRRVAAEESKPHPATNDDGPVSETVGHLSASEEDSKADTRQSVVGSASSTKLKKSSGKKKTSKKTTETSPKCQGKNQEVIGRKLVDGESLTIVPLDADSVEMKVDEPPNVNGPIASESKESVVSILDNLTDENNFDSSDISVDVSSGTVEEKSLVSAAESTFSYNDEPASDNDVALTFNCSEAVVNASPSSLAIRLNSDMASSDLIPDCLNLDNTSKNSAEIKGVTAVDRLEDDLQPKELTEVGDQSWDALFDDSGEALHSEIMSQITDALGTITVQKPQFDYLNYQPKDPEIGEEEFEHLLEIYDFPASLQTADLVIAFKDFQDSGFEIKWVDDTHAIGVFSGRTAARSALATFNHPLMKVRLIQQATRQTKLKAKKCTEFLQPYKPRPVMVASVARNLVAGALGLQTRVSKEKREEERQKLKAARDLKRASKRQKEEAWEGTIGRCAMDEA